MTILQSERLILRPLCAGDLDDLATLNSDPEVMRFLAEGLPLTREQTQERLERNLAHWREHGFGVFVLLDRTDGRFVGRCGLGYLHDLGEPELSYAIVRRCWGRGLASEAVARLLRYAFEDLNLPRVLAAALVENVASQRVMLRSGMTLWRPHGHDGKQALLYAIDRPGASAHSPPK
jgi:ribosomal-protein-alanine N-acetyltransferase